MESTAKANAHRINVGGADLEPDHGSQALSITYRGMGTPAHLKQLGTIMIPFEEIHRFEDGGKNCVRIILKRYRSDWSTHVATNALNHPLAFLVSTNTSRQEVSQLARNIESAELRFSGREFTPPVPGKKLNKPANHFGDIKLAGNTIVHNGSQYPIAGASATIGSGVSGGAGLSLKRAAVGGFLIGDTGAILGGLSGDSGKVILEVTLADGRLIVAAGKSKETDAAVSIVNEISEWSPRLAEAWPARGG